MTSATNWAGKRLGLPESGSGSLAKMGRRVLAICIDWAMALFIAFALFKSDNFATLAIFGIVQWLAVSTLGSSPGHRICGLQVRRLEGTYVGFWRGFVRAALLLLVLPAVIWDADNRGLHDKIAQTVIVRS